MKTDFPGRDEYDGIVLHYSSKIVVLRELIDFEFDGIEVLNRARVVGVRDDEHEICSNKLIRNSKEINKLKTISWISNLVSLKDAIIEIYNRNIWPAIEIIEKERCALYIGPITRLNNLTFGLCCYDATGQWEAEYKLRYLDIARIEINSRYTNNFNRFMTMCNPLTSEDVIKKKKEKRGPAL